MYTEAQRKENRAFIQWLSTKPIDRHLALTMSPEAIARLKDHTRIHTPSYTQQLSLLPRLSPMHPSTVARPAEGKADLISL